MRRLWRLAYAFEEVSADATQVAFTLELLECSTLDRATWPLTRSHLDRQYARAMLRMKALLKACRASAEPEHRHDAVRPARVHVQRRDEVLRERRRAAQERAARGQDVEAADGC